MSTSLYDLEAAKAGVVNRWHSAIEVTEAAGAVSGWGDSIGGLDLTVTAGEEPAFRDTYPSLCRIRAEYLESDITTSNPRGMTIPSKTYDKRNFTAMWVIDCYTSHPHFQVGNDDNSAIIWKADATSFVRSTGSGFKRNFDWNTTPGSYNFTAVHSPASRCVLITQWSAAARNLYLNGRTIATGSAATAGTFASAGRIFRDGDDTQFFGGMDEQVFWDTASTPEQIAAITAAACAAWGINRSRVCLFCGDSITYGWNTPDRMTLRVFHDRADQLGGGKCSPEVQYMFGKPGWKASEAVTNYSNMAGDAADTFLQASWGGRRAFINLGNNDIRLDSAAATTVFGNLVSLAKSLRTSGASSVEIGTICPWTAITAAHDRTRMQVNAWLKGARGSIFDYVYDWEEVPGFRNTANTAVYFDGIHWTTDAAKRAMQYVREVRTRLRIGRVG